MKNAPDNSYHMLRPVPRSASTYSRCDVVIFVAKDYSHVLLGGGEYGFDGLVNEVDAVGLQALADRYPLLVELQQASAKLNSQRTQAGPEVKLTQLDYAGPEAPRRQSRRLEIVTLAFFLSGLATQITFFSDASLYFMEAFTCVGACVAMVALIRSRASSVLAWLGLVLNLSLVIIGSSANF